jgi:peptidyl-prolyl cis-trans isomerase D
MISINNSYRISGGHALGHGHGLQVTITNLKKSCLPLSRIFPGFYLDFYLIELQSVFIKVLLLLIWIWDMLQKLNERIQGAVAWLVVILIGITFTLFGVDYYVQSHNTRNAKVTVNGVPLTEQVFETNYRRARGMQDIAQMTAEDEKKLQVQVLDQMVRNEVLLQAAHKNGFDVSISQANAAILSIPQFQEDGHFSAEKYEQALSAALFTQVSFQNEVKQGMLLNQQRFAFIASSFALPDEIERFIMRYMQNRDYDYLVIPGAPFKQEVQISPEAIAEYYKNHQKEFKSPEQVSLDYVVLSMNELKKEINISDEEIKRFYNENKNNYLSPAQWRVAHILFAIPKNASAEELEQIQKKAEETYAALQKDPSQFNQFVTTHSDDKLSIAEKGVLPWITAGQNSYDKILSNLTRPGDISAPEKTKYGYELFKLIDYKPVKVHSLAEVEAIIKEQLLTEMSQTKYTHALEQLSDLSYQSPDSLNSVASRLKLKIQKTKPFSRAGGTEGITKNQQVINAAFSHDVLQLGTNSEPVQLDNDSVVVVRVNNHRPEEEQSLDQVKEQINQLLLNQAAQVKAQALGKNLMVLDNEHQMQLMNTNHLAWKSVTQATRETDKADPLINEVAFNLLRAGNYQGMILPNGDYAVVKLRQINDGKLSALDSEQQESLVQQIEASYGMMDYDLYVKNLMGQAQIVRP